MGRKRVAIKCFAAVLTAILTLVALPTMAKAEEGESIVEVEQTWEGDDEQTAVIEEDTTEGSVVEEILPGESSVSLDGDVDAQIGIEEAEEEDNAGIEDNDADDMPISTQATSINLNQTQYGSIYSSTTSNQYSFTLSSAGRIQLTGDFYLERVSLRIFNSSGSEVWSDTGIYWNSTTEKIAYNKTIDLTRGTYTLAVEKYYSSYTGSYSFKVAFTSANESISESQGGNNNDFSHASSIVTGTSYRGQIAQNDDKDFYRFKLDSSGRVNLTGDYQLERVSLHVYDAAGAEIWSDTGIYWNSTTERIAYNKSIDLTGGTYTLAVEKYYSSYTGNYSFKLAFTSANESFAESQGGSNNGLSSASSIATGKNYRGQIALNDDRDFYSFTVGASTFVRLRGTFNMDWVTLKIFDASGNEVWSSSKAANGNTERVACDDGTALSKGTYYLGVVRYWAGYTGPYSFSVILTCDISRAKAAASNQYYTGDYVTPNPAVYYNGKRLTKGVDYTLSYRNNASIGRATVIITGVGEYSGTKEAYFNIVQRPNGLQVKAKQRKASRKKLRYYSVTVARPLTVKGANGYVRYKKKGGSKRLSVDTYSGKVTVKYGTKKGTYKIKIAVTAAGDYSHAAATKVVTCKVVVK